MVSIHNLAEATWVVVYVDSAGIRVDYLDRAIKKLHERKELQQQYQNIVALMVRRKAESPGGSPRRGINRVL